MSVAIKLYQRPLPDSLQEFLAVIPSFPRSSSLSALRKKIDEEELINGSYVFVLHKADHSKEEETVMTALVHAKEQQVDLEIKFVAIDEDEKETVEEEGQGEDDLQDADDASTSVRGNSRGESSEPSTSVSWQIFKSPKPWEVKNIKIYTPEEICKARGVKAAYCKFWNKRVKALCSYAISKQSICKKVNDEWRLEQETILKKEAEIIQKAGEPAPAGLKAGTLNNNIYTIAEASTQLKGLTARLQDKNSPPASRKVLLAEQARAKSKLKRAQETMRKNLKVKKSKIDAVVGN